ncbi:MAG: hypothetical protein M3077_05345 [Candidatus Dormibacteraeota bacterium]|nr:hypothetical protein [Candidatus Dormibacteraeota bacterium]
MPVTPEPPVGDVPAGTVNGGQTVAHPPLQALTPGESLVNVYTVIMFDAATRIVPLLPTVCARTTGLAPGAGGALGVGVGGALVVGAGGRLGVGVAGEPDDAWVPQAARAPASASAAIDARQWMNMRG